jgi:2-oxoglutarate dehydrogenase E2 component (dihydrolipoamide succinyltransferase)
MPVEIRVPQLGESIVEATVAKWLKKEGDPVAAGETVAELETDKVAVEVTADEGGILQKISQQEGDTVEIGAVLGLIGTSNGVSAAAAPTPVETPAAAPVPVAVPAEPQNGETKAATPLARSVAETNGVDLRQVQGSGPAGRVTRDDVAGYLEPKPATPAPVAAPTTAAPVPTAAPSASPVAASLAEALGLTGGSGRPEERVKMSRRRQTIATRLVEAQHTAAMLTTFNEIDMSAVMAVRARRKDSFKERYGVGLGFMSFFTKASIGALKAFPLLNAEIQGTDIVKKFYYDIGIAVGAEEGLVVPVVRDADRRTFAQIEREIGELAKRARENKLTLPELQGGTFTITNGGIFGSMMSTPILNAPQVGILGLHKIEERPVVVNKEIVIKPMMYVALSYDHRIVDGSEAVRFLVRIKELIEDPESLLIEG